MKSLAILTLDFHPDRGGVQNFLYETARRMTDAFQITVLTPVPGALPPNTALTKKVLPRPGAFQFLAALRALKPDRVLAGHAHPRLLIPAALYTRKYALLAHGNDFLAAQRRWHRPLFNWLLRRGRPLIANSHDNAARLTALGCPSPTVIHPGTDPDRFMPSPSQRANALLTVSRLVPRKGIDTVLHALPAVLAEFPDLRYRIAGKGPDRARLEGLARQLNLTHAVDFLGYVPDHELPALYQNASVFVMPSREEGAAASVEGFGIVYLEAAASGLPVIAGRSGGAVEAVCHQETGFLVPPDDSASLAEAVLRLLRDPDLRGRMARAGRRWVEQQMNWARAARQLAEALA